MRQSIFIKGLFLTATLSLGACSDVSNSKINFANNIGHGGWKSYDMASSGYGETSDAFCEGQIGDVIELPDPTEPPVLPPPQNKPTIASTPSSSTETIDLLGAALNVPVTADHVGKMGQGSYDHVQVTATSIQEVGSMSANRIDIESGTIGRISSLSVGAINILAHTIDHAGSFSGTFCASIKKLKTLHSLSSKLTIYGNYSGGTRASIDSISSMSAFVSLHDLDIGSIHSGSFRGRIENSFVENVSSSSGEIYLVNSRIEKISGFSGTIHLIGGSTIGRVENSSVTIVE